MNIFNTKLLKIRRNAIAKHLKDHNFFRVEILSRIVERIDEIKQNFPNVLEIGSSIGELSEVLHNNPKITHITQTDIACNVLKHNNQSGNKLVVDPNMPLPFKDKSFDMVIAVLSLHQVNNLLDAFKEIYRVLKPNSPIITVFPTYGSLQSLGQALYETEMNLYNIFSPRMHPLSDIKTLGNLLQKANFSEIVADQDSIEVMYKNVPQIFKDLKYNNENNILLKQNTKVMPKDFFLEVEKTFEKFIDTESKHYPVKVEFANLIAWKV